MADKIGIYRNLQINQALKGPYSVVSKSSSFFASRIFWGRNFWGREAENVAETTENQPHVPNRPKIYQRVRSRTAAKVTMISTLRASPVRSLFYALREVYVPLLVAGKENVNWNQSSNLEESAAELLGRIPKTSATHLEDC